MTSPSPYAGSRDPRFVTLARGGLLDEFHHHLLASWAADCAAHVLPLFTAIYPSDPRPHQALDVAYAWSRGEVGVGEARQAAFACHDAARESNSRIAALVAHAAGHAVAVAHMADHELGAAAYAIRAVRLSAPPADALQAGQRELDWQRSILPAEIRELVLSDELTRNQKFWSLFF